MWDFSLTMLFVIVQGASVNFRTADCVSPLHEACLGGHAACVSVLLKHGANVSTQRSSYSACKKNK